MGKIKLLSAGLMVFAVFLLAFAVYTFACVPNEIYEYAEYGAVSTYFAVGYGCLFFSVVYLLLGLMFWKRSS